MNNIHQFLWWAGLLFIWHCHCRHFFMNRNDPLKKACVDKRGWTIFIINSVNEMLKGSKNAHHSGDKELVLFSHQSKTKKYSLSFHRKLRKTESFKVPLYLKYLFPFVPSVECLSFCRMMYVQSLTFICWKFLWAHWKSVSKC